MPTTNNQIRIGSGAPVRKRLGPERLAKSTDFAKFQRYVQIANDASAPHFAPEQEPLRDGVAYRATDGRLFYRPQLRIAARQKGLPGPEVRFLKDVTGQVRLHFDLEEALPSNMPRDAQPFSVRVDEVRLCWDPGPEWVFEQPLLVPRDEASGGGRLGFIVRVGAPIPVGRVDGVYTALSSPAANAFVQVKLTFSYWLDEQPSDPTPRLPPSAEAGDNRIPRKPLGPTSRTLASTLGSRLGGMERLLDRSVLDSILRGEKERREQPGFQTVTIARRVPFIFQPELDQNKPIYSALIGTDIVTEAWADSPFGPICKAPFPNTVYRLPDELRLAYNEELGIPHVVPTLYRDADGEPRVRVTLRAVPWQDPEQIVGLRDWLERGSAGALVQPDIVIGGYKEAKLSLTTMFPESIQVLGGDGAPVSLEEGIDLTLDLTLEFYRFLCELLTKSIGLTGDVAITIEAKSPAEGAAPELRTWRRQMRLRLDDLADLPVEVSLARDGLSPTQLNVTNRCRDDIQVAGCLPRLLQVDGNSVVPLGAFEAVAKTSFPIQLGSGGSLTINVEPKPGTEVPAVWNAVQVELLHEQLVKPAKETLERVHEVMPEGSLEWKLKAECPVFLQDPVASKFENLYQVEVQVLREGYAAQQIMLGRGTKAAAQVSMRRTLREVIGDEGGAIETYRYRVRNIYYDHAGSWSEERLGEGSDLIVFPNPVDSD